MPTSVHIPKPLLVAIDRNARALNITRNRLIVTALEREIARSYARLQGKRVAFMTAYETFRAGHDLAEAGLDRAWARSLRQRESGRPVKG